MRLSFLLNVILAIAMTATSGAADEVLPESEAVKQIEQLGGHVVDGRPRGLSINQEPIPVATIPFWAIVTPLTLLAGYLLLSKPRSAKSQKPA